MKDTERQREVARHRDRLRSSKITLNCSFPLPKNVALLEIFIERPCMKTEDGRGMFNYIPRDGGS